MLVIFGILWILLLHSTFATIPSSTPSTHSSSSTPTPFSSPPVLPPWSLEGTVEFAMQLAATVPLTRPTTQSKSTYLETINGIVQYMRHLQDPFGRIIDPFANAEIQYSTPCFAFSCATVYSEGLDDTLLNNCTSALSISLEELANKTCADGHCVFFMKPVMFAYRILIQKVGDTNLISKWNMSLTQMNPWIDFGFPTNNWGLVGSAGDYLRTSLITNFGNSSWSDAMMKSQLAAPGIYNMITPNGLYQDHTGTNGLNPLPYDTFPVSGYLTVLMREGYNGTFAPLLTELNRRAAFSHLIMQSPMGEIPTGGRSSQHQWNEAVSCLAYEIFASYSKALGDDSSACQFKRAAHLSAESVARWQNKDGPFKGALQIVKNHFDPSLRFGYEGYSFLTNYNNLPAAMLSAAFMYADDSIPECSAPADVGGFVFQLPEHHLIIANAAGLYTEIETSPDPNYDPLGLHRLVFNTCGVGMSTSCVTVNPLLSMTAGPPCGLNAEVGAGGAIAYGPYWREVNSSTLTTMSSIAYSNISGVILTPAFSLNSSFVSFTVDYFLPIQDAIVSQFYELSVGLNGAAPTLTQRSTFKFNNNSKKLAQFGLQLPVFLFDGVTNTTSQIDSGSNSVLVLAKGFGSVNMSVIPPNGELLTWNTTLQDEHTSRNGFMKEILVDTSFSTDEPALTVVVTAES